MFVLNSLISHSLNQNVFCTFIDFTKAFDSIDRNLLYAKLMGYKISVKMLKMIVNIYSKVKSKVRPKVSVQEPLDGSYAGRMSITFLICHVHQRH